MNWVAKAAFLVTILFTLLAVYKKKVMRRLESPVERLNLDMHGEYHLLLKVITDSLPYDKLTGFEPPL